jgi:hypothetical protein
MSLPLFYSAKVTRIPWWKGWLLWRRQGRPRDFPVVADPGRMVILENGGMILSGWSFIDYFMSGTLDLTPGSDDLDRLWEYLIEKKFAQPEWMGVDQWRKMRASSQG